MILIFFTNDINEYPLTSTFIIGLLLQYTDIIDVIRYKHTDEDAMDYEIAKWVTDTYIQHHKILNPWPYGRKFTDYRIIVGDNG